MKRHALSDILPYVLLLMLATAMLYPVALGDRPVSMDHTVHFYKAWHLKERLGQGMSPYGWSHDWFAGYPTHYHYPVGAYFVVVGIHALSFGLISFSHAYGLSLWLTYVVSGWALYVLGKRLGGRMVGLIGACLLLTDSGADFSGGWEWTIRVGAWPIAFSIALALMATVSLDRLMEDGGWPDAGRFGLLAGLALIFHPIQLVYLPSAVFLLLAARACPGPVPGAKRVPVIRLGAGLCLAVLIGSFWLLPLLSSTSFALALGFGFLPLEEIGKGLALGSLFEGMWPYAMVLGAMGSLGLLFQQAPLAFFTGMFSFGCLLFASREASDFLRMLFPGFAAHFEFFRMVMLLKPFWFAAAAWMIVLIVKALWRKPSFHPSARGVLRPALACLALAPLGVAAVHGFLLQQVIRPVELESARDFRSERRAFAAWADATLSEDRRFFRLAHGLSSEDHAWVDLGVEVRRPLYKLSFTPAMAYKYCVSSSDPGMLKALNVRYWLHPGPLDRKDLTLVKTFGELCLYELKDWSPDPFSVMDGKGTLKLLKFSDEEIVLQSAPGSFGTLRLNVSYFDRWKATLDGAPVAIGYVHVSEDNESAFITTALKPGRYRFSFERSWPERLGVWLLFAGMAAAAGLLVLERFSDRCGAGACPCRREKGRD